MKRCCLVLLLLGFCSTVAAQNYVKGYMRRDGTYVQGYYRTPADGYFSNNYSTYQNFNPYTGNLGTRVTPYPAARDYWSYPQPVRLYQPYQPYRANFEPLDPWWGR